MLNYNAGVSMADLIILIISPYYVSDSRLALDSSRVLIS